MRSSLAFVEASAYIVLGGGLVGLDRRLWDAVFQRRDQLSD